MILYKKVLQLFLSMAMSLAILFAFTGVAIADSGTITINMTGFENNTGQVLVAVFASETGFPEDTDEVYAYTFVNVISNNQASTRIQNLPYGSYAVAVIHDENRNFDLDKRAFGIPTEGIGFSNNVRGRFGPPDFEDAAVNLNRAQLSISIEMYYY